MQKRVFYKKLFTTYIAIILLYTFFIIILFSYKTNELKHTQVDIQNRRFIENVREQIDKKLSITNKLVNQLLINKDIINYSSSKERNYYFLLKARDLLKNTFESFSDLGTYVTIGKPNDSLYVSSIGSVEKDKFFKDMGFNETDKARIIRFLETNSNEQYLTINSLTKYYNYDVKVLSFIASKEFSGGDRLFFFISYIKELLFPVVLSDELGLLLLLEDNKIILEQNRGLPEDTVKALLSYTSNNKFSKSISNNHGYKKDSHKNFDIHIIDSEVMNWKYVFFSYNNTASIIKKLIIQSAIIYLIFIGLGVLLTYMVTKRMYLPVKKILSIFTEDSNGRIDEFTYIEKETSRIKESNVKLKEIIRTNSISLKDKLLKDLLLGIINKDKISAELKNDADELGKKGLTVAILDYTQLEDNKDHLSEEGILSVKAELLTRIKHATEKEFNIHTVELDYNKSALIIEEKTISIIQKQIVFILSEISASLDINIVAFIGSPVDSVYDIFKSYKDAIKIMEFKYVFHQKVAITMEDINKLKIDKYFYPLEVENNLIKYVIQGKEEESKIVLDNILRENFTERKLSKETLSLFIFAITATVNRILQHTGKSIEDIFDDGFITYIELKTYKDIKNLEDKIKDIFCSISTGIKIDMKTQTGTIAERLKNYIHHNYKRDISLVELANQFNLSPGYVSVLFRSSNSMNFKDYLNMYRINKAKEILNGNKSIKIKELSEIIGFNSTNTFIRIFKKYEGISPGKYVDNL